jgi:transcriptional regulator with XRE-family HTH domain
MCKTSPDPTGVHAMARSKADSGDMSAEGERVKARRERLGLDKRRLATEAGVSRETLGAIEGGQGFRNSSLVKIERVLESYEAEAGITEPVTLAADVTAADQPSRIVIIRLKNDVGEVVLEGPAENQAALVADARRLLDYMRTQDGD